MANREYEWYGKVCPHCGKTLKKYEPKERLGVIEDRTMTMLRNKGITSEKAGLTMRQILKLFKETYGNKVDTASMSEQLKMLRVNGFLSYVGHTPTMMSKTEQRWSTPKRRKMLNWVSDAVLLGELKVDQDRWVIFRNKYIADIRTRSKVEAREYKKR